MDSNTRIVLIANSKTPPDAGYAKHMMKFDFAMLFTNEILAHAIQKNGYELVRYYRPTDFINNISKHKDDLIFPYYNGIASKIRQAYIQTTCETYSMKYIGADGYVRVIANDKVLAKEFCKEFGIKTPACKVFFHPEFPPDISVLNYPVIVKPRHEGDSIGISYKNIFKDANGVIEFCTALHADLKQPLLIEEYLEGTEISIAIIGYKRNIKRISVIEHLKKDAYSYFDKKMNFKWNKYRLMPNFIDEELLAKLTNLFHALDKIEFVRLDFILNEGKLFNIEITADPALGSAGSLYGCFKHEMKYGEFINYLICNSIERYEKGVN